ncbi:MAG: TIR domain-containing protein [Gammaproteobacteria bacterium]|nr:TIR domain-containing protein [Gammaproteobacteria bacterium]MBU1723517.1 TIR domain-containing protein [Gammaproteobacteria bacterium]MBU2004075.1 TIR domain-containing protein [Gammaproteobacteria bacterium]
MSTKRFQVALSFPGEYRDYVLRVAEHLAETLGRDAILYDAWYKAEFTRPNLDTYLQNLYHKESALLVPFLCTDYASKDWCQLEWRVIRELMKQRRDDDIMPMRFDKTHISGLFDIDGYLNLNDHKAEEVADLILQRLKLNDVFSAKASDSSKSEKSIHSDRLPTVKGGFFGRTAELQLLNNAWANTTTRIVQFIAPGGTGKTKLLRHWLDHTADIPVLIAWSFYSQGASEDKQTSATPFFSHAFEKLGSTRERFASEEDKGDHLAELLHGKRYVLVLDGLEPLQHGGAAMRGELKDKAIRQLLRQLARHPSGLCIITTRIALHELSDRDAPTVIRHDLQNLTTADGIQLLQSLGVKGSAAELGKAVGEYGGHALALSLLGNVLRLRHQGDVRKRDTLKALVKAKGNQDSRHAFKVMQAYAEWFAGEPELALLHLLGLFDHPIGQDVLQMLWDAQIPYLTAGIDEDEWLEAIASLREEHHLLSQHDSGGDLDCHPLIREYFGGQLQTQQPQAWQQAHERLYEYYKALPKNPLPDTLEEMQPLFSAVAHGCAAGLHQQALDEVYWPRIKRGKENYTTAKLGAFSDDLATVAHFFTTPWHTPAAGLQEIWQAGVLNWAGFCLRALGRLREALERMQVDIAMAEKQEDWKGAAQAANNLSELQLTLGDVAQAVESGARSSRYADQSGDMFLRMGFRTTHADALHQAGDTAAALALFRDAEQLQQERQPAYPRLYGVTGFRYCDLLLAQGSTAEVLERAEQTLEWAMRNRASLLDVCLQQLTLGRAHLQQLLRPSTSGRGAGGEGLHWLDQAVAGLRAARTLHYLPRGLLTRAALHRHTRDFARARQDLQEVFDIADGSGMRLHLTDYHLEMARLLVAEEKEGVCNTPLQGTADVGAYCIRPLQYHIAEAERLIEETGYHRRDQELLDLQQALAKESCP